MLPIGEVGMGEFLLALIPTINLVALAFVYKLTGKAQGELSGKLTHQTEEVAKVVHGAKQQIRDDLKNGIRHEVEEVVDTVKNQVIPRLDNKRVRLDEIDKKLEQIQKEAKV